MSEKILITNLKSKNNIQDAVSEVKPDRMIIISSKKAKFRDFEVKTDYMKIKNRFEDIIHKANAILNDEDDFSIIVRPDRTGVYLLWLAQMRSLNPTYVLSHGELQQLPIIPAGALGEKESEILKLADCHGFIDSKSVNKEFGITKDSAKEYLKKLSDVGILKYFETKEFEAGEEKAHAYYSTDLLEKGKQTEDLYLMTELGRIMVYMALTSE
ncbi:MULTISPECIES: hypothetical protein [Methanobacterium]|uniref:Uncharacterized protein n=1 Tax=Methanobacterium bryantii TaxID=2161 RepID=A0A2A2H645_METBR|nr:MULTISPECIES: hypothetical protein [Methanobacterium]OEC88724.1 hypothetical protein A9507_03315 [Methanobacterium sp. A39]PAV04733.1 hypothetical protein ASJ80_10480 [Methanobacterium bryantii]